MVWLRLAAARQKETEKFMKFSILFPTILLSVASPLGADISAIWANDGGDKVTQDELRVGAPNGRKVLSYLWDSKTIAIAGAQNEVVSFNLVLEAAKTGAKDVKVSFETLEAKGGKIQSKAVAGDDVFNWVGRPIELFFVRYLPIKGLSIGNNYGDYDERHVPERLRRPWSGEGHAEEGTGWTDRPDHDKAYPDIAVPLELVPRFDITAGRNQSIWADIYIPKDAAPGVYRGDVTVKEAGGQTKRVPVTLTVYPFALPDVPTGKSMLFLSGSNINERYLGKIWIDDLQEEALGKTIQDRHFLLAHRHKISLIGDSSGLEHEDKKQDRPNDHFAARLRGDFFSAANGYDGPGAGVGNTVYSVQTYGIPKDWQNEKSIQKHCDAWVDWFDANAPQVDYFVYLIDESKNFGPTEKWAQWMAQNPGVGKRMPSMATAQLPDAAKHVPTLNVVVSQLKLGVTKDWEQVLPEYTAKPDREFYLYNGVRPFGGSFCTEDDGVSLWVNSWIQYRFKVDRYFFWEATFYTNREGGGEKPDLFTTAKTFGPTTRHDPSVGETGANYANGDGVLMYPGTDKLYPASSYGVKGPFASLRLKQWRRGLQDHDYLTLAGRIGQAATTRIVERMIPKVAWELGVADPEDPTWQRGDISWSVDPDVWAAARKELVKIITRAPKPKGTTDP